MRVDWTPSTDDTGVTGYDILRDGTVIAAQIWMAYEAGAFPGSSVGGGVNTTLGPYKLSNVLIDGFDVVVNAEHLVSWNVSGAAVAAAPFICQ